MKLDTSFDYEAYADSYMKVFRPVVYKTYRNDEFMLCVKRTETVGLMKRAVAAISLDTEFVLRTELSIGKYDFGQGQFPVKEASDNHYWYKSAPHYSEDLPSRFEVYLSNPELIQAIPMSEQQAQAFLASRKNRYGDINRSVHAEIRFKIVRLRNGQDEFDVEIQSAQFFDRQGSTHVLHKVQRKADEQPEETASGNVLLGR